MSADRILMLKLLGDTSSIDKSLKKSQGRLRSFAGSAGSWMKAAGIGLAIEGVAKLGETLGDAWTGFREGEKASAQLGTTWKNLGLDGSKLKGTIEQISAITLKLGTDDVEAMNAYNTALQNTGGRPAAAMNRLRIAQDLVANGSAPNLQSALKLIDRAGSGSAATVRKFGLTADTAKGRIKELGEKVKGASDQAAKNDPFRVFFNAFNEGLEGAIGSLASGDLQGALASISGIGAAASATWTAVFPAIDTVMTGLLGKEQWQDLKNAVGDALFNIGQTLRSLGRIWDGLAPHVQNALNLISPLVGGIMTIVGLMGDNIRLVLDAIVSLLNGDFSGAWTAVQGIVGNVVTAIQTAVGAVVTFLQGILPGILGAAAAIGDAIWMGITGLVVGVGEGALGVVGTISGKLSELLGWLVGIVGTFGEAATNIGNAIFGGIVSAIGGLADTVSSIFSGAVTALRDAWNSLDFAIPAFNLAWDGVSIPNPTHGTIADVFGTPNIQVLPSGNFHVWDGTGDLIPDLAQGGIIRKRPGGMLARIGEGRHDEAVIPLDGRGVGSTIVNININATPGTDRRALGLEIIRLIRAAEAVDGRSWRTAPGR